MNEHEDLISRLRALGRRPVERHVADGHLSAMAEADAEAPAGGRHRLRIVAAFAVGLLVGTTGLATAGALPHSAQEVAHTALGAVGVNVPHGARYQGPECGGAKNHGQYVRSQPKEGRAAAAASRCGKPLQAGQGGSNADGGGKPGGDCQGPPPWAGKGKPDQAAKDARKQACGGRDDEDGEGTPPAGPESTGPNATQGPAAVTPDPQSGSTSESTTTPLDPATTTTTSTTTTGPAPVEEPTTTTTTGAGLDTTPPTPPETGLGS